MADEGDVLANFMAITGADDEQAISMLEATGWQLDEAVNLFYAAGDGIGGGAKAHSRGRKATTKKHEPDEDDFGFDEEDEVRAPIAAKMDRLYGDVDPRMMAHMAAGMHAGRGMGVQPGAGFGMGQPPAPQPQVDVFRDFKAEQQSAAAGTSGLSDLFKTPADLLYPGTYDMAKAQAASEGKWMLVNVQSNDEFASHQLNRDTWRHEALKEMVKGMFVFFQVYKHTEAGRTIATAYHLHTFPIIMVVDPLTGAKLWEKTGFIGPDALLDLLVPFMDHGPLDPGAGSLAMSMANKRRAPPPASSQPAPLTEDDELAAAIAMSLEQEQRQPAQAAQRVQHDLEEEEDLDEAAIWEQIAQREREASAPPPKTPQELQQEAASRVPAEPAEGTSGSCRVALRMPDGSRLQRRFLGSDPVQALFDFVVAQVPEAVTKRVEIMNPVPGAGPLASREESLEQAHVANAMLVVKLLDT